MATYTYADWITLDAPAARLVRLRLHIQEVSVLLASPDLSGDGKSVQYGTLLEYHRTLMGQESALAGTVGGGLINGGASLARLRRAR